MLGARSPRGRCLMRSCQRRAAPAPPAPREPPPARPPPRTCPRGARRRPARPRPPARGPGARRGGRRPPPAPRGAGPRTPGTPAGGRGGLPVRVGRPLLQFPRSRYPPSAWSGLPASLQTPVHPCATLACFLAGRAAAPSSPCIYLLAAGWQDLGEKTYLGASGPSLVIYGSCFPRNFYCPGYLLDVEFAVRQLFSAGILCVGSNKRGPGKVGLTVGTFGTLNWCSQQKLEKRFCGGSSGPFASD